MALREARKSRATVPALSGEHEADGGAPVEPQATQDHSTLKAELGEVHSMTEGKDGSLRFRTDQLAKFNALRSAMRNYAAVAVAASGVAVAKVALISVTTGVISVPPSGGSRLIVGVITAGMVWKTAALLPQTGSRAEEHQEQLMRSLRAMTVVFLQMGTLHWFVSVVTMMEAAITWPNLVVVFSIFVASICLLRVSALGYVMDKFSQREAAELEIKHVIGGPLGRRLKWLDRAAVMFVGGGLAAAQSARQSPFKMEPAHDREPVQAEYEFTEEEEKIFTGLMDSLYHAAICTVLMCIGHGMAFTSKFFAPHIPAAEWIQSLSSAIESGGMAGLIIFSNGCFANIISSQGQDVKLLMEGISAERGLTELFTRLTKIQFAAIVAALIPMAMSFSAKVSGKVF